MSALFLAKMPLLDFCTLSPSMAALVVHYFKFTSASSNALFFSYPNNVETFSVTTVEPLVGIDLIWRLAIETQAEEVR